MQTNIARARDYDAPCAAVRGIMKRIYPINEPLNIVPRPNDPWQGISADVIRRFVDVLRAQHALPTSRIALRAPLSPCEGIGSTSGR